MLLSLTGVIMCLRCILNLAILRMTDNHFIELVTSKSEEY